jgi:hypothetical protein
MPLCANLQVSCSEGRKIAERKILSQLTDPIPATASRSLQRGDLRVQLCGCAIRSPSRALIALAMSEIARSAATMASSGATLAVPSSRTVNPLPMMERTRLSFSPALRRQASTMSSLPAGSGAPLRS